MALERISTTDSGTTWSAWQRMSANLASSPAVSSWGGGRLDVFALGQDMAVYHTFTNDGATWTYWQRVNGAMNSAPAAASQAAGSVDLFVRGRDLALYHLGLSG